MLKCQETPTKLKRGTLVEPTKKFGVNWKTVTAICVRAKETGGNAGVDGIDVSSRKKKCGRKRKEFQLSERICEVPLNKWELFNLLQARLVPQGQLNIGSSSVEREGSAQML